MSETSTARALLGFRVGGVQEFIDSARTTEDFWASSYLISHLTQQVARKVTEEFGEKALIFPSGISPRKGDESDLRIARFPNGILAEVTLPRAATLGPEIEDLFHRTWTGVMDAVRAQVRTAALASSEAGGIWDRQARRRAFETFWAWTRWDTGEPYLQAYQRLSASLEARKLLRDFDSAGDGEPNTKCTQCGKLQALQDFKHFSEPGCKAYWKTLADHGNYRVKYRFRASERLCAACVTCRMASRSGAFGDATLGRAQPSTSSIAVAPFLLTLVEQALDKTEVEALLVQFEKDVRNVFTALNIEPLAESPYSGIVSEYWRDVRRFDGDWFFQMTYDGANIKREHDKEVDEKLLRAARQSLKALTDAVEMQPSAYLALVAMDGDEVGDWISGKKNSGEPVTVESHRKLSQALARIGPAAQPVIEEQLMGRLIYAGGDDLLFLVPIANLVGGIHAVLQAIKRAMGEGYERFRFSAAALAIPHNDSLSGSIREAEILLKNDAKEKYGRDCVVVSARRQSGQRTCAALKSKDCAAFQTVVSEMAKDQDNGGLSPRIAGQFSMLAGGMDGHADNAALEDMGLFLLGRHANPVTTGLRDAMMALTDAAVTLGKLAKNDQPGKHLDHALLTARFLVRSETSR